MKNRFIRDLLIQSATQYVDKLLEGESFSDEHLKILEKAFESEELSLKNGSIILPDNRKWSLITINREYIAQLGLYFSLKSSYPNARVVLEDKFMDIVVYQEDYVIAIEVKKSSKDVKVLLKGLLEVSRNPDIKIPDRGNDPLRKAKAILNLRPNEFWLASPETTEKFKIEFIEKGFTLQSYEVVHQVAS